MMKHLWFSAAAAAFGLILSSGPSHAAEEIELPEEELARETTLPVFETRQAVLRRKVEIAKRLEFGVGAGLEVNEPFYNDYLLTLEGTYNYNNTSALNIQGIMWMDGLSTYGEQLKSGGGGQHEEFDAMKAPHPKWGLFANYQFTAYYGKISLTKKGIMHLSLFGIAGLGYINMEEVNTFGLNLGFGQNLFFTENFGLRADIRWLIFQGPNPPSQRLRPQDSPAADAFGDRVFYNTQLGLAAIFML